MNKRKTPLIECHMLFCPITAKKTGASDVAVTIVPSGSEESEQIGKIILKELIKNNMVPRKWLKK